MERRLAAILAADVVNYTALMGADEAGTHQRLTELRQKTVEPVIADHRGRIFKLMGDGFLVEFGSIVDAVACAMNWQKHVAAKEIDHTPSKKLQFRIGISLGDVIVDDDDIHGDGVNIAARLESLATPCGICLSEDAYRQVNGKVDAFFDDMGKHNLKNIAEPVRIYRISGGPSEDIAALSKAKRLMLPDKPSIAVLPFENMSDDPNQEHFADGMAEDILTALSRLSDLFVIDRHSSFSYKGKAISCKQVGEELGVRYVLEGSIRRSGDQVRITAQLIDAMTGNHLWAERFDRTLDDVFATQDEITRKIVIEISGEAVYGQCATRWQRDTENFEAWILAQQAFYHYLRWSEAGINKALNLSKKALVLDPDYGSVYATMGWGHFILGRYFTLDHAYNFSQAMIYAEKALEYENAKPHGLNLIAQKRLGEHRHDEAISLAKEALSLAPNSSELHFLLGSTFLFSGYPKEAIAQTKQAMRISPFYPNYFALNMIESYRILGNLDRALEWAKITVDRMTESYLAYVRLTSILSLMGRRIEAHEAASTTLALYPAFSSKEYTASQPYKHAENRNTLINALLEAGLPE